MTEQTVRLQRRGKFAIKKPLSDYGAKVIDNFSAKQIQMPALDGIRGIAILLVLFVHLTVILPDTLTGHVMLTIAGVGWAGVELFFVLSGFLITGILLDSRGSENYFQSFYIRRILRIMPLYFAVTAISFLVLPHINHPKAARFATVGHDEIWYWLMMSNIAIAKAGGALRHGIMDVTWSIAIEEHFYLIWPFVVAAVRPVTLPRLCVGIFLTGLLLRFALLFSGVDHNILYVLTPTHLDGLSLGALVACGVRSSLTKVTLARIGTRAMFAGAVAFSAAALVSHSFEYYGNAWIVSTGFASLAVFFAGFVLRAYLNGNVNCASNRILSSHFLRMFGKYSYAIYLFNLPLRALVRDWLIKPETFSAYPGGAFVGQLVFYFASGVLCLAVAAASYHLFEKHFLRLKRRYPANLVATSS